MALLENLKDSIIVVGHPDDEILWFSSILKRVGHIVLCYSDEMADPQFGARRRKMVEDFPLKNTSTIGLSAVGVWRPQSFVSPSFNKYGIKLVGNDRLFTAHQKKYKENYYDMRDRLPSILSGYRNVITHNPWGEYGHEEHVQVYRVVCELQKELGYDIWYSGYCSTRTMNLVDPSTYITDAIILPTDVATAKNIMEMYVDYGCWTWYTDWQWPMQETFFKQGPDSDGFKAGKLVNLNLIMLPLVSREKAAPHMNMYRRLKALIRNFL